MCKSLASARQQSPDTLKLSRTISNTKFPVLLAKCSSDDTEYIVKAFTRDSYSRCSYLREKLALTSVNHQNIISYVSKELFTLELIEGSYIIMEYAPYGDFFNLTLEKKLFNEKLIRTYFHHLIQGLEHIHGQGLAHLDLKLENLLLGKDYLLKIADFDVAQQVNDLNVLSQGSENYRAPEIYTGDCANYQAADIYSAGICLFIMLSRAFPFIEDEENGVYERYESFVNDNAKFWEDMESLLRHKVKFSNSLRDLLNGMWKQDPTERFTLDKIKSSKWYRGPVYSYEELKLVMQQVLRK